MTDTLRLTAHAPAKLNLLLAVGDVRGDGYHDVVSVMQTLDLCDRLEFDVDRAAGDIDVLVEADGVPGGDTLVTRAVHAVLREAERAARVWVTIDKQIPVGGGLGGGSSNAATALVVINALLGSPLTRTRLHDLAADIGSDVPFFIDGPGTALVGGRGQLVQRIDDIAPLAWLLCTPPVTQDTARVYRLFDELGGASDPLPAVVDAPLLARAETLRNDLTRAACAASSQVAQLVQALRDAGGDPLVAGSGATVAVRLTSADDQAAYEAVARQAVPRCEVRAAWTTVRGDVR